MKILVLNGPNLNLLGSRETDIYGSRSYADLLDLLDKAAEQKGIEVEVRQTNHEGVLVDWIQGAVGVFDAIVINPAAYTHTSVALLDALKAVKIPTVEVHISDPDSREEFRKISFVRPACIATVKGKGLEGYLDALDIVSAHLRG